MKDALDWREEAIAKHHDRKHFDCGVAALNDYLDRIARQNHESGGAKSFVTVPSDDSTRVQGFYSISPGSVEFSRVPTKITKKLARYEVPVFRLARLAVSVSYQGRGLGADLLLAAGERAFAVASEVGGVALAIDAKDERAANWYARFGAVSLLDDPLKLILPLDAIVTAIQQVAGRRV